MRNINGEILSKCFISAFQYLEVHKEEVNALNVFPVPDGDTGTNMSLTMRSAAKQINALEEFTAGTVAKAASSGSLMGARGNSGVILSQILRGFAVGCGDSDALEIETLKDAFSNAYKTAYKAVMKPTEGTILTVIRAMGEFAEENYEHYEDIFVFFDDILEAGQIALDNTPNQLPVLKEAGVIDAGGQGLCYIVEGMIHYETAPELIKETRKERVVQETHQPDQDIEFGYCTEFMIHSNEDYEAYRDFISSYGDSLIVVGADGLIKTHIHTNNPGEVIEKALQLGSLSDIKIDNMRIQHQHVLATDEELKKNTESKPREKYGFIAISSGKGLDKIFTELSVNKIISGGQTMNPSTEDILKAIDEVHADNVFVFPNNKNIILTAKQAKDLSDKNIIVIETTSIPEAYSAILAFDEDNEPEKNEADMNDAIVEIKTAQITYSVRDTTVEGIKVKKGDYLCILDNKIINSGSDIENMFKELCKKAIDDDVSIVTIYCGEDSDSLTSANLRAFVEEEYEDLDIDVVEGGQPVYSYLISFE